MFPPQTKEIDEDDWGEEISEEAVKQRLEELTAAAKGLAFTDDLEKSSEERINMLYQYIKVRITYSPLLAVRIIIARMKHNFESIRIP